MTPTVATGRTDGEFIPSTGQANVAYVPTLVIPPVLFAIRTEPSRLSGLPRDHVHAEPVAFTLGVAGGAESDLLQQALEPPPGEVVDVLLLGNGLAAGVLAQVPHPPHGGGPQVQTHGLVTPLLRREKSDPRILALVRGAQQQIQSRYVQVPVGEDVAAGRTRHPPHRGWEFPPGRWNTPCSRTFPGDATHRQEEPVVMAYALLVALLLVPYLPAGRDDILPDLGPDPGRRVRCKTGHLDNVESSFGAWPAVQSIKRQKSDNN